MSGNCFKNIDGIMHQWRRPQIKEMSRLQIAVLAHDWFRQGSVSQLKNTAP